jgi:enoyl-[acyl-carrier protein] reductase I
MQGKRGLIMGVANDHSIAWGIARAVAAQGAELAFTYQGEALGKRVKPLAESLGSEIVLPCDVEDIASVDAVFEALAQRWGQLDFVVHAIGFSDKNELKGRYIEQTTRENFSRTMVISCFSFTEIAQRAAPMMNEGGSLLTLTYGGATRVMPNYNVMGLAKAALESSVRYLASDLGPQGIRVNAISAGPIRTLAGAGIGEARAMFSFQRAHSPLRRAVSPARRWIAHPTSPSSCSALPTTRASCCHATTSITARWWRPTSPCSRPSTSTGTGRKIWTSPTSRGIA